jgi:hypothetical protein
VYEKPLQKMESNTTEVKESGNSKEQLIWKKWRPVEKSMDDSRLMTVMTM